MSTVLVPLDGSAFARRALPYGSSLARATGGKLLLIRALRALAAGDDGQGARRDKAAAELRATAEGLRAQGLEVEERLRPEEAPAAIVAAAEEEHADLVVMATHGRGGLARLIFGSTTDRVLRGTRTPVLLIPPSCQRPWDFTRPLRVLVPLDGSAFAEAGLRPASALAARLGASLVLLRVVEWLGYERPGLADLSEARREPGLARAWLYLERIAAQLRAEGRTVEVCATAGAPAAGIDAVARESQADLVVMATHGPGGLGNPLTGSVAAGALQRSAVPLLLIQPRQAGSIFVPPSASIGAEPSRAAASTITLTLDSAELDLVIRGLDNLMDGRQGELVSRSAQRLLLRLHQPVAAPS